MAATPTDPLWINVNAGVPSYTANELRVAFALGLMYAGRRVGGRAGVRPGGDQLQVSYSAPTITVQPGVCALDPGLTTPQGPYWGATTVADTFTLTAADATNPRKDIVIARVYDHDEDASGLRRLITEYLVGTPAASPSEPALPTGTIKLALLDVPASPGAVVVTDRRPWTAAPGGILRVPDSAAQAALTGYESQATYRDDTDGLYLHDGSTHQLFARKEVASAHVTESTDILGFTDTAYAQGSPVCGVAFVAPPSGIVVIFYHAQFESNTIGVAAILSVGVRAGGTPGSGADQTTASDAKALRTVADATAGANQRFSGGSFRAITNLTPGNTYNVVTEHHMSSAGNGDIFDRSITVIPLAL